MGTGASSGERGRRALMLPFLVDKKPVAALIGSDPQPTERVNQTGMEWVGDKRGRGKHSPSSDREARHYEKQQECDKRGQPQAPHIIHDLSSFPGCCGGRRAEVVSQ
jgi:hypothetical protein